MLFSTVALFLSVAASASATVLSRQESPYPACANDCIAKADLGDCGTNTNLPCLCKAEDFIKSTTTCIQGACTGADLEKALAVSQAVCASVGVTLSSAPAASTTATSPGAAATTTPAVNATTTGAANATATGTANSTSTGGVNATSTGNSTAAPTPSSPSAAGSNSVVFSSFVAVGAAVLALAL